MKKVTIPGAGTIEYVPHKLMFMGQRYPNYKHLKLIYQIASDVSSLLGIRCPDIGLAASITLVDQKTRVRSNALAITYHQTDYPEILTNSLCQFSLQISDPIILIGSIAHECRHIWQYTDPIYKKNPPAESFIEALNHPDEIDADAFALSFIKKVFPDHSLDTLADQFLRSEKTASHDAYQKRITHARTFLQTI